MDMCRMSLFTHAVKIRRLPHETCHISKILTTNILWWVGESDSIALQGWVIGHIPAIFFILYCQINFLPLKKHTSVLTATWVWFCYLYYYIFLYLLHIIYPYIYFICTFFLTLRLKVENLSIPQVINQIKWFVLI